MRKQKHMDDLMAQANELRHDNSEILNNITATTQQYHKVESENSILRARMAELTHRLQSLNDILKYINTSATAGFQAVADNFINPANMYYLNQPIMASADLFHY